MRKFSLLPSAEYLRACFDYDPNTGALTRKTRPRDHFKTKRAWATHNATSSGKRAGYINSNGYHVVGLYEVDYLVSRIVMKMITGEDPLGTVDHHDRNPLNNRWDNLRPATQREQNWNQKTKNRRLVSEGFGKIRDDGERR